MRVATPHDAEQVLGFWLDEVGPAGWYAVDQVVDQRCTDEFGSAMADALAGHLRSWQASPRGALALLLLLDQFPRNVHRGTAAAHAADARSLALAKAAIGRGHDLAAP